MNQQELYEAAEILVAEIEAWPTTADGNVMTTLAPADDQDSDFRVKITFFPLTWRHHPEGEKIVSDFYISIGAEDWDGESKEEVRGHFREALESIDKQYETTTAQRALEDA
jgi:hypothetical protein